MELLMRALLFDSNQLSRERIGCEAPGLVQEAATLNYTRPCFHVAIIAILRVYSIRGDREAAAS